MGAKIKKTISLIVPFLLFIFVIAFIQAKFQKNDLITANHLASKNKKTVVAFFTTSFVKKDIKAGFEQYVGNKYIQHNPHVADGREQPIQYLGQWLKENPQASCEIKRVIAENDLVVIHSHWKNSPQDRGQAGIDIFRVENDKIVEHWDVLQDVPEKSVNTNTVF